MGKNLAFEEGNSSGYGINIEKVLRMRLSLLSIS
jgi:hypothetical protein